MSDLLQRLRAYAAANPTDVKVIAETVREAAELEAYEELARLTRKWRLRAAAAKRRESSTVDLAAEWRGRVLNRLDAVEEPFLLQRRIMRGFTYARTPSPREPT